MMKMPPCAVRVEAAEKFSWRNRRKRDGGRQSTMWLFTQSRHLGRFRPGCKDFLLFCRYTIPHEKLLPQEGYHRRHDDLPKWTHRFELRTRTPQRFDQDDTLEVSREERQGGRGVLTVLSLCSFVLSMLLMVWLSFPYCVLAPPATMVSRPPTASTLQDRTPWCLPFGLFSMVQSVDVQSGIDRGFLDHRANFILPCREILASSRFLLMMSVTRFWTDLRHYGQ